MLSANRLSFISFPTRMLVSSFSCLTHILTNPSGFHVENTPNQAERKAEVQVEKIVCGSRWEQAGAGGSRERVTN